VEIAPFEVLDVQRAYQGGIYWHGSLPVGWISPRGIILEPDAWRHPAKLFIGSP